MVKVPMTKVSEVKVLMIKVPMMKVTMAMVLREASTLNYHATGQTSNQPKHKKINKSNVSSASRKLWRMEMPHYLTTES